MKMKVIYYLVFIVILLILMFIIIKIEPSQKFLSPISKVQPTSVPKYTPAPTNQPSITPTPTIAPTLIPTSVPSSTPASAPTFTPTPTLTPLTSTQLEDLFTKYANIYSVDKEMLKKIAYCESKYNTNARSGDYLGMYQFSTNTWINNRNLMTLDNNPDLRTNAEESIKTAAFVISRNGQNAWQNCIR